MYIDIYIFIYVYIVSVLRAGVQDLPVKGNCNSHGAGPVRVVISVKTWTWTGRLAIKQCLLVSC